MNRRTEDATGTTRSGRRRFVFGPAVAWGAAMTSVCAGLVGAASAAATTRAAAAPSGSLAFGGRLIAADGGQLGGVHVVASDATGSYEAIVDSTGVFVGALPSTPTGQVILRVFSDSLAPRYHASLVTLGAGTLAVPKRIVLLPAVWRIRGGAFDGRDVRIDPARAVSRFGDGAGYWRLTRRGRYTGRAVTWVADSFPLRVAFRRDRTDPFIAPADSVSFWRMATELERRMGWKLFRPASFEEVDRGADGIFVTINRGMAAAGRTFITHDQTGRIYEALVTVREREYLAESRIAAHEMLHALGLGHTGAWPSVMGPSTVGADAPSADDVAYAQLFYAISRIQREREADFGIPEAARE